MIGKLISSLFNFILTIIMSVIQLICLPLNLLFENVFPDFSKYIDIIESGLSTAFSALSWAVSLIPPLTREIILLMITIEISLLAIFKSTHATAKVWKILQKLKFW